MSFTGAAAIDGAAYGRGRSFAGAVPAGSEPAGIGCQRAPVFGASPATAAATATAVALEATLNPAPTAPPPPAGDEPAPPAGDGADTATGTGADVGDTPDGTPAAALPDPRVPRRTGTSLTGPDIAGSAAAARIGPAGTAPAPTGPGTATRPRVGRAPETGDAGPTPATDEPLPREPPAPGRVTPPPPESRAADDA